MPKKLKLTQAIKCDNLVFPTGTVVFAECSFGNKVDVIEPHTGKTFWIWDCEAVNENEVAVISPWQELPTELNRALFGFISIGYFGFAVYLWADNFKDITSWMVSALTL